MISTTAEMHNERCALLIRLRRILYAKGGAKPNPFYPVLSDREYETGLPDWRWW